MHTARWIMPRAPTPVWDARDRVLHSEPVSTRNRASSGATGTAKLWARKGFSFERKKKTKKNGDTRYDVYCATAARGELLTVLRAFARRWGWHVRPHTPHRSRSASDAEGRPAQGAGRRGKRARGAVARGGAEEEAQVS